MQLRISPILDKLISLTPSSISELKDGKNVFEILQLPAGQNRIAEQLYTNWEDKYRQMINTSMINEAPKIVEAAAQDNIDHTKPTSDEIDNLSKFDADPTKPDPDQYKLLARQLRDYYERHEDDDNGPWWRR